MGIRCSVESGKVKSPFSNWILEKTTLLESNSVFDIARWTLLVLEYGIWALPDFSSKFKVSRSRKILFGVFCEEKRSPEASFTALLAEQFFVFKSHFWECLNFEIICLIEFGVENENIFWMLICERRIFQHCNFVLGIARHTFNCFQIIFSMSPLICLFIVGWVRCVKPSFTSNFRTNDLFGKFFPFKTVCDWRLLGFKCGFWTRSDVEGQKSSRRRINKAMYMDVILLKERFFRVILFSALLQRLLVFTFGIWALTFLQSKIELNSEI